MKSINSIIFIVFLLFVAQCSLLKQPKYIKKGDRHKGHKYYHTKPYKPEEETKEEEEVFPSPTQKIVTDEGTIHTDGIKEETKEEEEVFPSPTQKIVTDEGTIHTDGIKEETKEEEEVFPSPTQKIVTDEGTIHTAPYKPLEEKKQQQQVSKPNITRKEYEKLYNITFDDEEDEEKKPQSVPETYNFLLTEEQYLSLMKILKDLNYELMDANYPREKIFDALEKIERNLNNLDLLDSYTLKYVPEVFPEEGFINNTGVIFHPEYIANQEKEPEEVDDEEEEEEEPKEEEDEEEEEEEQKEEEKEEETSPAEEVNPEEVAPVYPVNPEEVAPVYPEEEETKEVQKEEVNQPEEVKEEETEVAPIAQATKSDQVQMQNVAEAEPVAVTKDS